jgi:hypothetical protein
MVRTTTLDEQLHEDAGPDLIKIDVEGADLEVLHRPEEQDHPPLAKRGTRPIAPRDQRTASTYIFGAVRPKQGKGAALILPTCNTESLIRSKTSGSSCATTGSRITSSKLSECKILRIERNRQRPQ